MTDLFEDFLTRRREARARKAKMLAVVNDLSRDPDERHACHILAYKIGVSLEEQPIRSRRQS